MSHYESLEEIEMAITSDLQSIDVNLASIVSVMTGIHRATQQYTQAIRSASQHLQTWTRFFVGYRPGSSPSSQSEPFCGITLPQEKELTSEPTIDKENQPSESCSRPSRVLQPDIERRAQSTPQFASPLHTSVTKTSSKKSDTPDLKSPLLTAKRVAVSEATPDIQINPQPAPNLGTPTCNVPSFRSNRNHCLLTPDFSSPPFGQNLHLRQFDVGSESTSTPAPAAAPDTVGPVSSSSLDLDLSFISSVKSSDSPRRLDSEHFLDSDTVSKRDLDNSISFSVPTTTQKLADISALLNQQGPDSFSLGTGSEAGDLKNSPTCNRSELKLDFAKLPSIYRSGHAQKQMVEVFDRLKAATSPLSSQSLAHELDRSEAMINLMIDVLHQKNYIRPVFEDNQRKWIIMS